MLNIAALQSDSPFRSLRWRAACAEHVNAHGASMVTRQGMDNLYARAYLRFLQSSEAKRIDPPADDPRLKHVGVAYLLDQDQESLHAPSSTLRSLQAKLTSKLPRLAEWLPMQLVVIVPCFSTFEIA